MQLEIAKGTAESDGEDIYWELVTTGPDDQRPVVVLSHGAGGTHAVWYQQVPLLGQNFRVLTWDSRGFGNSTNRSDSPSAEAAAGDLVAVLDAHQIEAAHLVGQSMGGWHISALAVADPDRILSLVYADTVGGLWTPALREAMVKFSAGGGLTPQWAGILGWSSGVMVWDSGAGSRPRLPVPGPRLIPFTTDGQAGRSCRVDGGS